MVSYSVPKVYQYRQIGRYWGHGGHGQEDRGTQGFEDRGTETGHWGTGGPGNTGRLRDVVTGSGTVTG